MNTNQNYYKTLFSLATPIMIQMLFINGLSMVDTMLVGQLGDSSIASVGLAGQVLFLLSLIYFGLSSGSSIFIAQFWGRQDVLNIRKVYGLNLMLNFFLGTFFTTVTQIFAVQILNLFTNDPQVISMGSQFVRIASWGYIFHGISYATYMMLRSTENVKIPMIVAGFSLSLNTLMGYIFIFGKLRLPAMGIRGAALAFVISRLAEMVIVVLITRYRHPYNFIIPIFNPGPDLLKTYTRTVLPVAVNELFWALGITFYTSIYAHIGTDSVAATNISATLENLAFVPFLGVGSATAILVGKKIGSGDTEAAFSYGKRSLILSLILAFLIGGLIFLCKGMILDVYKISDAARNNAHFVITALSIAMLLKTSNFIFIVGTLRAGGDTRFTLFVEIGTIWFYGIPLALVAANIWHLPVYFVVTFVYSEELLKLVFVLRRFISRRWIHQLMVSPIE